MYARGVPSAKTIKEIKHLAAVKMTTVAEIIHRAHSTVREFRALAATGADGSTTIGGILMRNGLGPETV